MRAIRAHGVPSITNPGTPPLFQLETLPDWGDRRHPVRDFHRGRRDILETQIDDDPYDDPYLSIHNDPCDPDFDFEILEVRHQRRPPLDRSMGELTWIVLRLMATYILKTTSFGIRLWNLFRLHGGSP